MALVIYKQRHAPIFKDTTPRLNAAHVHYIATRPGCVRGRSVRHGLFGNLTDEGVVKDVNNLAAAEREVKQVSENHKHVFRCLISFDEKARQKLGLESRSDWERLVNREVRLIAEKNGVRLQYMRWVAAIHGEAGHPHCHLVLWDGGPSAVTPNFVSPKLAETIRQQLIRDLYPREYESFVERKNEALERLSQTLKELMAEFEAEMDDLDMGALRELWDDGYRELREPYSHTVSRNALTRLAAEISTLSAELPQTGRLAYGVFDRVTRDKVDAVVKHILVEDEQLRSARDEYVEIKLEWMEMYRDRSGNDEAFADARARFETEADKRIANALLHGIRDEKIHLKEKEYQRAIALRELLCAVFGALTAETDRLAGEICGRSAALPTEYSKQAKKEYARQNQHGETW